MQYLATFYTHFAAQSFARRLKSRALRANDAYAPVCERFLRQLRFL